MNLAPLAVTRALAPEVVDAVRRSVRDVLEQAPGFQDSHPAQRRELAHKLVRVALAGARLVQDEAHEDRRIAAAPLAVAQSAGDETDFKAAKTAAATIKSIKDAIDFPTYVSSLISGVFQAITQSSIKQVESLIDLLDHVSAPAEDFANAEIGDDAAATWATSRFRFIAAADGALAVRDGADISEHKAELKSALAATDDEVAAIDGSELAGTLLPLVRRKLGRDRQAMLGTLIQLGLQRVVVDDGRLHASMDMRVDTRSAAQQDLQDRQDFGLKAKASGSAGGLGWGVKASVATNFASVHSDHKTSKEEVDTRAGLRSTVDLAFRTEQIPLDRLADEKARVKLDKVSRVPVDVSGNSILEASQPIGVVAPSDILKDSKPAAAPTSQPKPGAAKDAAKDAAKPAAKDASKAKPAAPGPVKPASPGAPPASQTSPAGDKT